VDPIGLHPHCANLKKNHYQHSCEYNGHRPTAEGGTQRSRLEGKAEQLEGDVEGVGSMELSSVASIWSKQFNFLLAYFPYFEKK
jgi:hypothetical protein